MAILPGRRLGPYEILSSIGVGGMGEVYRARDPRLNRDVAIKVSNAQFTERFEREAKAIAALNHPNICQIYDVGPNYLVMEYIEGESPKGPLPLDQALRIARQIAHALEAAHDKGITHRDLKPANIRIKPDGTAKVLDFGLAKVNAAPSASQDNSPTLSMDMTQAGMILGTASYMAPEQARGKESVDKRADIWAFGVVLYELLTGKRLFQGEDVSETLAAVIMKEPDLSAAPAQVLPLLKRCLQKDPRKRLRDIGDMELLLERAAAAPAPVSSSTSRFTWVAWSVAALAIVCALALTIVHFRETPPQEQILRFRIPPPENMLGGEAELSPDGRYLTFAAVGDGSGQLYLRPLNSLAGQPLPGTEGAYSPFWAPDSKSVGFFADGKLKRIEIAGGPAIVIADAVAMPGAAWGSDVVLFSPTLSSPLMRAPAGGGTARPATKLQPGEVSHRSPWFFPDGHHFLYLATREATNALRNAIHVGDLSSTEDSVIGEADSRALYSQGFLIFVRQGTLMAQPFDAQRRVTTGSAAPLEQQIAVPGGMYAGYSTFSASTDGLLAFRSSSAGGSSQLTWVDRSGKQIGLLGKPGNIRDFKFSPDSKNVVATLGRTSTQNTSILWIFDAIRGSSTRFSFDSGLDSDPVWSPDGRTIIFTSRQKQYGNIYRKSADGSGNEELIYSDNTEKTPTHISPDGKFLLYRAVGTGTGDDIWVLPLTPERTGAPPKPYPFAQSPADEDDAQFSPNGRWIAYDSTESQRQEVYLAHFPDGGGKRQISVTGGTNPRWRKDGKEIFYVAADGKVMAAAVTFKGDAIQVGEVRPLFTPPAGINIDTFEVSADGQRFLILPQQQTLNEGVTVVLNWVAGLKK